MAVYTMKYRCTNCGHLYENQIQKGVPATGRGGECPKCGIKDGTSGVGHFETIKESPDKQHTYN